MKLGSLHHDPEARAEDVARQQLSLVPLSLLWAVRPDAAATQVLAIIDTLEDQLYPRSFDTLRYQGQTFDAHPVS